MCIACAMYQWRVPWLIQMWQPRNRECCGPYYWKDACVMCTMTRWYVPWLIRIWHTGWRRLVGSPKLQVIFYKRATKFRSLLRKMTCKDKGSYESSPPCTHICVYVCVCMCVCVCVCVCAKTRATNIQRQYVHDSFLCVPRQCQDIGAANVFANMRMTRAQQMSLQHTATHCNTLQHMRMTRAQQMS